MKIPVLAALGFALGIGFAKLEHRLPELLGQVQTSVRDLAASAQNLARPPGASAATLHDAMAPVYEVLFGPPGDPGDLAAAIEDTAELEKLLAAAPRDAAGDAARRVGALMKAARLETELSIASGALPASTALGNGSREFFGGIYRQRWQKKMSALARTAAPLWQTFIAAEASASYPRNFQMEIEKLLARRHLRQLERTAIIVGGVVAEVRKDGAIFLDETTDYFFVAGLTGVGAGGEIRVLAHPDGTYLYTAALGAKREVPRFRFFRVADN